jgi:membrane associated rhomboid family serine protease
LSVDDRDYWRGRPEPAWTLGRLTPRWVLIGSVTLAFLVQNAVANAGPAPADFLWREFPLSVEGLREGRLWQPITYLLLHVDFMHLFWNMLGLLFFASVLESRVSPSSVYGLFLAGGLAGAAGHVAWCLAGFDSTAHPVAGASGAVTALLVAGALRAPGAPFLMFLVLPVPLWVLGVVYLSRDVLAAVTDSAGDVAVQAHIGGAVAGAILTWRPWRAWSGRTASAPRHARPERDAAREREDAAVDARVDALLARIHAEGIGSLDEEEREFLRRASERYRGRRG